MDPSRRLTMTTSNIDNSLESASQNENNKSQPSAAELQQIVAVQSAPSVNVVVDEEISNSARPKAVRQQFRRVKTVLVNEKRRLPHSSEEDVGSEEEKEDNPVDNHKTKLVNAKKQRNEKDPLFTCHLCKNSLANGFSLRRHKKKVHGLTE